MHNSQISEDNVFINTKTFEDFSYRLFVRIYINTVDS